MLSGILSTVCTLIFCTVYSCTAELFCYTAQRSSVIVVRPACLGGRGYASTPPAPCQRHLQHTTSFPPPTQRNLAHTFTTTSTAQPNPHQTPPTSNHAPPAPQALRLVRRFRGHTDRISDLQLSADCRWLLSASLDNTVRVWDVPGGCLGGGGGLGLALWHALLNSAIWLHSLVWVVHALHMHMHKRCLFSHLRWHSHSLVDVTRRKSTAGHLPLAPRPAACAAGGYTRWPHAPQTFAASFILHPNQ